MAIKALLSQKKFIFSFEARTSRGPIRERQCWFVKVLDTHSPHIFGIGECAPLPGLSPELEVDLEAVLQATVSKINHAGLPLVAMVTPLHTVEQTDSMLTQLLGEQFLNEHPSLRFALETAFLDLAAGGERRMLDQQFTNGQGIPINGLIWMGEMDFMLQQIELKIREGFRCIKLKVGGLDFVKECDLLQSIRRQYRHDIEIRLDANGAFKEEDALPKLKELARFNIHSIEQPIKKGSPFLAELCRQSPIPIALDEELIGLIGSEREALLKAVNPRYIILKPSLHGGMAGTMQWIALAEQLNIGWWITSALESNIGLNAIAQFTSTYQIQLPQGLGTGQIYENNFPSPLIVKGGNLYYRTQPWDISDLHFD
jgi:o-succinylbenzoate synthase